MKVWDVETGKLLWTFKESSDPAVRIEFDREGKWLIVEDNASHVYVIGVADHRTALTLSDMRAVVISPEGGSFMTADGKEFSIWRGPSWTKAGSIAMWNRFSLLLAAAPAADRFAVYESRMVRIAQLATGNPILDRSDLLSKDFTWRPTFGEFSSDGALLYLSLDDRLRVWDISRNEVCNSPVMYSGAGALSVDNQWFAGAKDDSILSKERTDGVWVWNPKKLLNNCGLASPAQHESK